MLCLAIAAPTLNVDHETGSQDVSVHVREDARSTEPCGRMKDIFYPTAKDWRDHKTSEWLSDWLEKNMGEKGEKRLDATWGEWAFGNPVWNCNDDGSHGCEIPEFCDNPTLNEKSDDELRMAYYVTLAFHNLNRYHIGISEALVLSGIQTALIKDKWYVYLVALYCGLTSNGSCNKFLSPLLKHVPILSTSPWIGLLKLTSRVGYRHFSKTTRRPSRVYERVYCLWVLSWVL